MILGMDVSHGSPGRSDVPSVADAVYNATSISFFVGYMTYLASYQLIDALYKYCYSVGDFRLLAPEVGHLIISRHRTAVRTQSPKMEMIDTLYEPLSNGKDDGIIRYIKLDNLT